MAFPLRGAARADGLNDQSLGGDDCFDDRPRAIGRAMRTCWDSCRAAARSSDLLAWPARAWCAF